MKRTGSVVVGVTAVLALSTSAFASWGSHASGSATAESTTLPTGPTPTTPVTATQTTGNITVTWPAATYVGLTTEVAGYTLARFKGGVADAVGGTCTGTLTAPTHTCTDTVASSGVYSYKITTTSGSWSGANGVASGSVTVNLARSASLAAVAAGTKTAGTSFQLTFDTGTALNGTNSVSVTGLGTSPSPTLAPPSMPTTASFTNGVATLTVTAFKAEGPVTVTATQGSVSASASVTVQAASPALLFSTPTPCFTSNGASGTFDTKKGVGSNGKTTPTIRRGTDSWANPVTDPNAGSSVTVSLTGTIGGSWSVTSLGATTGTALGSATWTNSSSSSSVTATPTATAPGYAAATCSYSTS